ncbi:MAG: EamA family transporter [Rhodobacteraceae bacterium]|nr:MAG: EamA family transporter [Paracoccaceae bacterium]
MSTQKSLSPRAWGELSLLALIWGGAFMTTRVVLNEVPVVTLVLHRTFWAALVLWGYVFLRGLPLPRDWRIWGAFLVMGLLNNVIPFGLMAWGQLTIESGLTSILNATTAIFGVLVAALFFGDERLTRRKALGVAFGFSGVTIAIGLSNLTTFDPRSLAQLAVLAGTLFYALASAWARARLGGVAPQIAAAGMLSGASLILLPAAWLIDGPVNFDLTLRTWGAIGYLTVIATAGAFLLYYRVLALAGSGNLMLVTLLIPPVAIVIGAFVLDEALKPQAFIGFALLALGLLVLNGGKRGK